MSKRLFDIVFSLLLLILLFPLLLVLALLIFCTLGRPIFFSQLRPGFQGKCFKLIKFRTMKNETKDNSLSEFERLTPLGKFLRATSLDEWPELINVLKGDMSLVGPRPLLVEYLSLYTEEQKRRHCVKPGITGLAQISGRNALSWEDKFNLDIFYVDNRSFRLDIKILLLTIKKVIKREGITDGVHATAEKFKGVKP